MKQAGPFETLYIFLNHIAKAMSEVVRNLKLTLIVGFLDACIIEPNRTISMLQEVIEGGN